LRVAALALLTELDMWVAAMLPTVLNKDCNVLAEYEAVLHTARTGGDPEFQRRASTGLDLYELNYVVPLAMARAPGAQQAATIRARDWVNVSRDKQTHHEVRMRLVELGLQQRPP
jgi:hypothetical protein